MDKKIKEMRRRRQLENKQKEESEVHSRGRFDDVKRCSIERSEQTLKEKYV